ncbi:MAG: glycosyltransferase, partial [Phycisphaerae bacterium]
HYQPGPLTSDEHTRYDCDISFVSNASDTPETLRNTRSDILRNTPDLQQVYNLASERLLESHRAGSGIHWHYASLQTLIDEALAATGRKLNQPQRREIHLQLGVLADRCFRHDGLNWAHQFCQATGRKLRIYGAGWEKHPVFAPYAAGPAAFGHEMNCIYQASRINLQMIETGFLHSRALDGLAAGGFFLARYTIFDGRNDRELAARRRIAEFLRQHPLRTYAEVRAALSPSLREDWDYLQTLQYQPEGEQVISELSMLRLLELYPDFPGTREALPGFAEILFHDAASFAAQAQRYLNDEPARIRLRDQMRQAVLEHYSYDARWRQFLAGITAGLAAD